MAIALGTYMGGWRIIRTIGTGITDVKPIQGFSAEVSTASAILASSHLGFALSTTQVSSGSVIGVGLGKDAGSVRWRTAGRIALAWLITLPAAAVMAGLAELLVLVGPVGIAIDALIGAAVIVAIFVRSRSSKVSHENVAAPINVSSSAHEPLLGAVETTVLPKDARKLIKRNEKSA